MIEIPSPLGAAGGAVRLFNLEGRGDLWIGGNDRVAFLQGLVTNDVAGLAPGRGCYAAFLTPKGKLLADLTVLRRAEELTVDCEPELAAKLEELLKKYVVFQDVSVDNRTAGRVVLHLAGTAAAGVLARLGVSAPPAEPHAHAEATLAGTAAVLVHERRTGEEGWDVRVDRAAAPALACSFAGAGATVAPPEALEAARIEAGIPRWGRELDESVLPNEAGLERTAISYTKGCYIGQETVARIKTYGHVNRLLVGLLLPPASRAASGAEVLAGSVVVGRVTSAAASPRLGRSLALAYVKREVASPGTELSVHPGGAEPEPAAVTAFPVGA